MAKIKGRLLRLWVGSSPSVFGNETSSGVDFSMSPASCTNKGSDGWEESLDGNKSWSTTGEAYYEAADVGFLALEAAALAGTVIAVEFRDETTLEKRAGNAYITNMNLAGSDGEVSTTSFTLTGTAALAKSTY